MAPTAPQNSPDCMAASVAVPKAGGGAVNSDTSTSGSRSVNSCSARADICMPGRIAPPRKRPVGRDQIHRDGRAHVDDHRRPAGLAQPIDGHGVDQPVDAHHVRPLQADFQRQIARGQQRDAIAGRCSPSQSISRVAAGRLTLAIHHVNSRPASSASQGAIASSSGASPSSGSVRIGSGKSRRAAAGEQPEFDPGVADVDGDERTIRHGLQVPGGQQSLRNSSTLKPASLIIPANVQRFTGL